MTAALNPYPTTDSSMAGILKQAGAFAITPHKVSLCILLKIYAPPEQISVPFPFSSVAHHNRLGLFLLALTKVKVLFPSPLFYFTFILSTCNLVCIVSLIMQSCDDIFEPKLDELIHQLRMVTQNWMASWIIDQLMSRLSALSSPDDLFNFFSDTRGDFNQYHSTSLITCDIAGYCLFIRLNAQIH